MTAFHGPGRLVTDGLVFLVDAGNHKSYPGSGASWTDLITKAIGTLTNITIAGGHINFNSSTSKANFGTVPSTLIGLWSGGGTLSVWMRAESDGEGNQGRILDTNQPTNEGWLLYALEESGGACRVQFASVFTGTNGFWKTTNLDITLNEWVNVTMVYDSDLVSNVPLYYINGELVTTTTTTTPTGTITDNSANSLFVGSENGGSATFDGDVDIVTLYNRSLTAAEIYKNFITARHRFGI